MSEDLIAAASQDRTAETVAAYEIVLQNVAKPRTFELMRMLPSHLEPGERVLALPHARANGTRSVLTTTSKRTMSIPEKDPGAVQILDPAEWRFSQFTRSTWRGDGCELVRGEETLTLQEFLPLAEAGRILGAFGLEFDGQKCFGVLGDLPRDPGHPPIAALADISVYEDRIIDPEWRHLPFSGEVTATADTAGNIAVTRGRNLAAKGVGTLFLGPIGLFGIGNAKERATDTRELYLLVEGPGWAYTHAFDPSLGQVVREFAQRINVEARRFWEPQKPAEPPAQLGGLAAELRELAGLRDEGILTEEEFAEQKRRLLGS
jgi:hypothetical protein